VDVSLSTGCTSIPERILNSIGLVDVSLLIFGIDSSLPFNHLTSASKV
jgi:hypothetical protein